LEGRDGDDSIFDLLLLLGPFTPSATTTTSSSTQRTTPPPEGDENEEEEEEGVGEEEDEETPGRLPPLDLGTWVGQAAVEGYVMNMVGLMENVVCRVAVLPERRMRRGGRGEGRDGGREGGEGEVALTPTALDAHDKCVKLLPGLFLGGYAHEEGEEGEEEEEEGREGGREGADEEGVVGRTLEVARCLAEEEREGGREGGWGMVMMECLPPLSASEAASPSPPSLPPPPPSSLTDHLVLRVRHRESRGGKKKKGGGGRGGGREGGRVEKQGGVTVLEPGALSEGHFAVVTLRREGGREGGWEGGWVVEKVELENLPSFQVGREREEN